MVQILNDPYSGNAFGRIGKGIGKGLSEQIPKEIERGRLSSGLKKLEQEKDLDPMQFFTRAATLPGASPQLIESLGKLARQRMQGKALEGFGEKGPKEFPGTQGNAPNRSEQGLPSSITTRNPIDETLNPYIPMGGDQILAEAGRRYNENPALFENDPQKAIQFVESQDQREQSISKALQDQRSKEQDVQSTVVKSLKDQFDRLGANVPSDIYSKIEDEAVNAVRSKKDGGKGITEYQAAKEYGDKLDRISKEYNAVDSLGTWSLSAKKAKENASAIKSLQTKFKDRGDLENFAKQLTSKNKLSPLLAYNLAYPNSQYPELNRELSKLSNPSQAGGKAERPLIRAKTEKIAPNLAEHLGQASPLSVALDLENKGYDPLAWMNYLRKNRDKLNLSERQGRELDIAPSRLNLNDAWLSTFGGLNKIEGNP